MRRMRAHMSPTSPASPVTVSVQSGTVDDFGIQFDVSKDKRSCEGIPSSRYEAQGRDDDERSPNVPFRPKLKSIQIVSC